MPRTIRWKLILSISIPLLATYLGMLAWDYSRQRAAAMAQMQRAVLERAQNAAGHIDARLAAVKQLAESTAAMVENRPNAEEMQLRMIAQAALRQNPWAASVTVAVEPGSTEPGSTGAGAAGAGTAGEPRAVIARRGRGGRGDPGGPPRTTTLSTSAAGRDWYAAARGGQGRWTGPEQTTEGDGGGGDGGGGIIVTYGVPIVVGEMFHGAVGVSISVEALRQARARPEWSDRPFLRGPRERGERTGRGDGDDPDNGEDRRERPFGPVSRPVDEALGRSPPSPSRPETRAPATAPAELDPEATVDQPLRDFAILDGGGFVIIAPLDAPASPPRESIFEIATTLEQHELADAARDAMAGQSRVVRVAGLHEVIGTATTDDYHWIALAPIPTTGWALISVIPESETMAPLLARIAQRGAFLLAGTVVLLAVVLLVSIRISRPIEQMAGAVDRLAAGDLDAQVTGITSRDELGRLAGGFNHMTRQLKAHVAALTEQSAAREKVESEMRIARQIQTDMLPKTFPPFPDRPEFELHAVNLPASRVAGDFYDFFFTPAGLLTVVIADVSGKGVPAALLMAVTRTIVRNLAVTGLTPAEIAERANAILIDDTSPGMFVTMLLLQYDPASGNLTYVNAGHPPAYRVTAGGDVRPCCTTPSPLLGVDGGGAMGPFEQRDEVLAPEEAVFLYTDGVTEARRLDGDMFGGARLAAALRRHAALPPAELCREMADLLDAFQAGQRRDDITLLVLRRSAAVMT